MTLGIRSWVAVLLGGQWPSLNLVQAGQAKLYFTPEIKQDYPPNLSILISGGKENNCDALSNGE